jgi:hypothetical protein
VPFEAFPERVSAFPLRFVENNNRFTFIIISSSSSSSLEHERGQIDGRYLVHHPKNDTPCTFTLVSFNELLHSHQESLSLQEKTLHALFARNHPHKK